MPRAEVPVQGRTDAIAAALIACGVFLVYAAGACPTIYVGDSGELVTAVHVLGIPHPSGYPLYVMLGKIWSIAVPFGTVAWRMSLFSALCGAAACGALFGLARATGLSRPASAGAALMLAFAPSFWAEANVQRVYTLNALFVVLASWATWRWHRAGRARDLALAFFLCGLGATNHTFTALMAVVLAIFALLRRPAILRRPARPAAAGAAFLAGLIPYLYLPLRSRADPPLDWGNPESIGGMLRVIGRAAYWDRAWIESPADLIPIGLDYLRGLGAETLWAGAALAVVGCVAARPRRAADPAVPGAGSFVLFPLLVMAANLIALALHGSRSDIFVWHRYYIPSYVMAALLAGMGAEALIRRLRGVRPGRAGAARAAAAMVLALIVPALLMLTGWREHDRSRYRIADHFSRLVLDSVSPGAHLIASDDNILFVLIYLHHVEGARPDVNLILAEAGGEEPPPLRFEPRTDPLFLTHHPNWTLPGLRIVPLGVVFRAWREGDPSPDPPPLPDRLDGEEDPRVPKDYLTRNLIGHFHYMTGLTHEAADWPEARAAFVRAARAAPDNDVLFFNLGLIYRRNGLIDEAASAFARSHAINPRPIAGRDRVRAADQISALEALRERLDRIEATLAADPALRDLPAGSAAWHALMADLLEARGEPAAARGHRIRAVEADR